MSLPCSEPSQTEGEKPAFKPFGYLIMVWQTPIHSSKPIANVLFSRKPSFSPSVFFFFLSLTLLLAQIRPLQAEVSVCGSRSLFRMGF